MNLEQDRYYVDENGACRQSGWFALRGVNGNGYVWKVSSSGKILEFGSGDVAEIERPETEEYEK